MFGSRQSVHHTFFKAERPAMFPCGGMWSRFCLVWGSGEDLVRSPFAIRQINYNHNSLSYTTLFDFAQYNPTTTKPRPSPHNSAEAASMLSSKLSDDVVWWWQSQRGSNVHNCYTAILFVHFLHTILLKLGFWGLIHRGNLQTLTNCANFQFTTDASCRLWINSRVPHSAPFDHLKVPKLTREGKTILSNHLRP